jgi:tetratricopeptide (TPR) repeat protein
MERRRSVDRQGLMGISPLWSLLLLLLLGSGGCSLLPGAGNRQEALSAPPAVKREIYREVAASLADNRRQGDIFLRRGDLHRALASYRQVSFYEQTPELLRKIAELESKIAADSKRLVAEGEALLGKDDEAALKAFNRALRLTPEQQEARRTRDRLLTIPRLQAELTTRLDALRRTWNNYAAQPGEIAALAAQSAAVLEYHSDNSLALKVEEQIDHQRQNDARLHLEKGLEAFQAGKLAQAKLEARKARAIDPHNPEVLSLLLKIRKGEDVAYFLNLARYRLGKGDHGKAEEFAGKALALDPEQLAAEAIVQKIRVARLKDLLARVGASLARGEYEEAMIHLQRVLENGPRSRNWPELRESVRESLNREVPAMIEQAQKLFAENKLRQAHHILAFVLELDPENGRATTYLKKVQSRLDTIESLQ